MIDERFVRLPDIEIPDLKFLTIPHKVYETTVRDIRFCVRATKKYGEPQCVPIEAVTGYGKTRLAEQQVVDDPPHLCNGKVIIPIWLVRVPSKATPLELVQYMLSCLGESPENISNHQPSMIALLANRIKEYVRDYVILDDIHYLLNVNTRRGRAEIAQVLADIIKRSKTTFVVLGIHNTIGRVLEEDSQLKRLFRTTTQLQPLQLDIDLHHTDLTSPEFINQLSEYATFIEKAEFSIGVKLLFTTNKEKMELLRRIQYVTGGVVGHIINLLIFSEGIADELNSSVSEDADRDILTVDLSILSDAFENKLKATAKETDDTRYLLDKENPFQIPLSKPFQPSYK